MNFKLKKLPTSVTFVSEEEVVQSTHEGVSTARRGSVCSMSRCSDPLEAAARFRAEWGGNLLEKVQSEMVTDKESIPTSHHSTPASPTSKALQQKKRNSASNVISDDPLKTGLLGKSKLTLSRLENALSSQLFQPDDQNLWYWDTVILLALTYVGIFTPYQIVNERSLLPAGHIAHLVMDGLVSVIFAIDIYVRQRTAQADCVSGGLVEDAAMVRARYFRGSGYYDLPAAIPIDVVLLLTVVGEDRRATPYAWIHIASLIAFKVPKFLCEQRLFKVATAIKLSPSSVYFKYKIVPIVRLTIKCALITNVMTLFFIFLQKQGVTGVDNGTDTSYVTSLYWTLYTITTVGYGDVDIDTVQKKLFACVLFVLGVVVQGVVVSKISSIMQKGDVESERSDTMNETLSVLKKFDIPKQLACEVLAYQYHQLQTNMGGNLLKVLSNLPSVMRSRVGLFVKMKFVCLVPMFHDLPVDCLVGLSNALRSIVYEPEVVVLQEGDHGREMFFLSHGIAEVVGPKGTLWHILRAGGFFGEIALLTDLRRSASVRTLTYCELFRLDKGAFFIILRQFEEMKEAVLREMADRHIDPTQYTSEFLLQAELPGDAVGIQWGQSDTQGFLAVQVDPEMSAHAAGIVEGMQVVAIDGVPVLSVAPLAMLEDLFQERGQVMLTMLPPTVPEDHEALARVREHQAEAEEETKGGGGGDTHRSLSFADLNEAGGVDPLLGFKLPEERNSSPTTSSQSSASSTPPLSVKQIDNEEFGLQDRAASLLSTEEDVSQFESISRISSRESLRYTEETTSPRAVISGRSIDITSRRATAPGYSPRNTSFRLTKVRVGVQVDTSSEVASLPDEEPALTPRGSSTRRIASAGRMMPSPRFAESVMAAVRELTKTVAILSDKIDDMALKQAHTLERVVDLGRGGGGGSEPSPTAVRNATSHAGMHGPARTQMRVRESASSELAAVHGEGGESPKKGGDKMN